MKGVVIWFTGLPSSGKSTLAGEVRERLEELEIPSCVLDGDEVRDALVPRPGYSDQERDSFYATLARLAALLARQGLVVLVPATAQRRAYRERARALAPGFIEVYVDTTLAECERRDAKGLFRSSRQGKTQQVPGVGSPYEPPERPDVVADGGLSHPAVDEIVALAR